MDEKVAAIIGANAVINASKGWAALTDMSGNYQIDLPAGTYTISFRASGKKTLNKTITVISNAVTRANGYLQPGEDDPIEFTDKQTPNVTPAMDTVRGNGIDVVYDKNGPIQPYIPSANKVAYKLHDKMTEKEAFLFCVDISGVDYSSKSFLYNYLQKFDKNFKSYSGNEFSLNEQINSARAKVSREIKSISYEDIYVANYTATVGEYNFETGKFAFEPFRWVSEFFNVSMPNPNYTNRYFNDKNVIFTLWNNSMSGLEIDKDAANRLVASFPTTDAYNGKKNRTVYLKVFYSVMKEYRGGAPESNPYPDNIKSYAHRIEVWSDKCMTSNRINIINSGASVPENMKESHQHFLRTYSNGSSPDVIPYNAKVENGQIMFSSIGYIQNTSNCNRPLFKVKASFSKQDLETYTMELVFQTNAKVSFKPGFFYTFTDMNGQDYPVVVKEVHSEAVGIGSVAVEHVMINVKRNTLKIFANNGIAKIRLQVTPSNERPATGEGYTPYDWCLDVGNGEWWQWSISETDRNQFKNLITKTIQ